MGKLSELEELSLCNNAITGGIPEAMGNLTNLKVSTVIQNL